MDSFFNMVNNFIRDVTEVTSGFNQTTWAILAVGTVVFGYMMLKGMNLQGR